MIDFYIFCLRAPIAFRSPHKKNWKKRTWIPRPQKQNDENSINQHEHSIIVMVSIFNTQTCRSPSRLCSMFAYHADRTEYTFTIYQFLNAFLSLPEKWCGEWFQLVENKLERDEKWGHSVPKRPKKTNHSKVREKQRATTVSTYLASLTGAEIISCILLLLLLLCVFSSKWKPTRKICAFSRQTATTAHTMTSTTKNTS